MSYTPSTDFVALWRNQSTGAAKAEMPAIDLMVSALHRCGLINASTSDGAPTTNQAKTAWFRPANPTYSGEGILYLWDAATSSYKIATPALFNAYLNAAGS